ncbi:MAG: RIP metalloprotease RseP [Verrucomicrobiota bacterium]
MAWLENLYLAAAVILLFGAAVFVHEWGHYWVARQRRMEVLGFSIGFGPKIFGWRDRHGVDWAVRWIPAGGFVKLPQMLTSEMIEGPAGTPVAPASPVSRILVALAGPVMNLVFAVAIGSVIWLVGLPVPVNPSIVGYVEPGSPEAVAGVREGDRILAVEGRPVRSWEDVQQITALAPTNRVAVELERQQARQTVILEARVNPQIGLKLLNLYPRDHPVVNRVLPDSAAAASGIQPGDQFVTFAGVPVVGQAQLVGLIQKRPGQASEVELVREGRPLRLTVTPRLDPEARVGRIGVEIGGNTRITYTVERPGPTPWSQISRDLGIMRDTVVALVNSRRTGVGAKDMSGPVGILGMLAGEVRVDFRRALRFMVMLNLNLALLNLLPLPVLDGGHILMALYELVTRRRISYRLQEAATLSVAALLISFMLYVTFNDVTRRLPLIGSHLKQESVVEGTPERPPAIRPVSPR